MKRLIPFLFLLMISSYPSLLFGQAYSLFNGRDLTGWHPDVPDLDTANLRMPFIVRNGMLVSLGNPQGHLITDSVYSNYRLTIEYRFAGEPGNCGVLVNATVPRQLYKMFPKSIEVQMMHNNAGDFWCIVEDIKVDDMVKRRGPKRKYFTTASIIGCCTCLSGYNPIIQYRNNLIGPAWLVTR